MQRAGAWTESIILGGGKKRGQRPARVLVVGQFGGSGFVKSGWVFFRKALKFDIKGIKASVATWAEISKQLGDEDRENTIKGILIIFAGFLLQAFGGFLWLLDVILPQISFHS